MAITVFHTSTDPAAILAAGFVNGDRTTGLGAAGPVGVMLAARVPAELVNSTATVRLLSQGEVDHALDDTSGPESRRR